VERLQAHYEAARTVRVVLEANGSFCRAVLSAHHLDAAGASGHANTGGNMYRHEGRDLIVIDGHMHFWDANPENWRNKYGESWIKCFYAYHSGLSPAEGVWSLDNFC
jgi:hypothetical protein